MQAEIPAPPLSAKRTAILDAAHRCFVQRGITATGVDTIAAEAGVSKRTLYNHFPSKDDLLLAYIDDSDRRWQQWLLAHLDGVREPLDRLMIYVDGYFREPPKDANDDGDPPFRGCLLINAAAEQPGTSGVVLERVQELKLRTHAEITELVRDAGVSDPQRTSDTIALLLEGGVALCGIHRDRGQAPMVRTAIAQVIANATLTS